MWMTERAAAWIPMRRELLEFRIRGCEILLQYSTRTLLCKPLKLDVELLKLLVIARCGLEAVALKIVSLACLKWTWL